jgi:hypothetical protein
LQYAVGLDGRSSGTPRVPVLATVVGRAGLERERGAQENPEPKQ